MLIPYYMIVNIGTMMESDYARSYPRHLVLAQQWQHSSSYRMALYTARRKSDGIARVILDNGAHEGIDIDIDEYMTVIDEMRPDVVVLTDLVGRPALASRAQALRLALRIERSRHLDDVEMMYAPQGETKSDILHEYEWAVSNLDPQRYIIGLGQAYLTWEDKAHGHIDEDARSEMVYDIMYRTEGAPHRFHILGARWRPSAAFGVYADRICGLDTIKPCTCALADTWYPAKPARPVDRFSATCADDGKLKQNVKMLAELYNLDVLVG